jgi:hypothetical protein
VQNERTIFNDLEGDIPDCSVSSNCLGILLEGTEENHEEPLCIWERDL